MSMIKSNNVNKNDVFIDKKTPYCKSIDSLQIYLSIQSNCN